MRTRRGTTFVLVLLVSWHPSSSRTLYCQDGETRNIGRDAQITAVFEPLPDAPTSRNAGVFVGVNEFTKDSSIAPLQFAVHDAVELGHLFVVELKLIPASHCYLALSGAPTAPRVRDHLQELIRAGAHVSSADKVTVLQTLDAAQVVARQNTDMLICAFSSHGFDEPGVPYVMPADGLKRHLSDTAIRLTKVEEIMRGSQAGHRLLLVDACQERLSADGARATRELLGHPAAAAFAEELKKATGQSKLASCNVGEFSYEHPGLGGVGHGVFSFAMLEALRGGAAADAQNLVRLDAVAQFVSRRVQAWIDEQNRRRLPDEAEKKQSPIWNGTVESRNLPLAVKADDLTTLVAAVRQRGELSASFDTALRNALLNRLERADLSRPEDRQLLATTREFLAGRLSAGLFVPYLRDELSSSTPPDLLIAPFTASEAKARIRAWTVHLRQEAVITNRIGMELALIPPGEFEMGISAADVERFAATFPDAQREHFDDERPLYRARIEIPFYLGAHEVTIGQFGRFVDATDYKTEAEQDGQGGYGWNAVSGKLEGPNPRFSWRTTGFQQTDEHPVVNLSWSDAQAFCQWLTELEGREYRLPAEVQWEYACRAGTSTWFCSGNDPEELPQFGNVADASAKAGLTAYQDYAYLASRDGYVFTAPIGSFRANAFGIWDLHGNVGEWCQDWYAKDWYRAAAIDGGLLGPPQGRERVYRGGNWTSAALYCRSTYRGRASPSNRNAFLGFRVVCPTGATSWTALPLEAPAAR
jgi:formylglycine-generating enzyme